MLDFLKCVAESVVEKGVRGLAEMVPGGVYAYDVAAGAWQKYRERKKDAEIRAEIQELAQASFEDARTAAAEVVQAVVPGGKEAEIALELYLTQIPGAVRQSLKRPDDPTGKTVPAAFALKSPEDVLKLLPPRPPRFRPNDPLPGKPGWVLERPLGVGGFGEVWLAKHPRMASLVGAVKFCHAQQARDLLHEGDLIDRVMQQGKHPHIVPLMDVNLDAEIPWLMFEYVPGGDLTDWIRALQSKPKEQRIEQSVAALRELAEAVGHFHQLTPAVVHRDLKPSNILTDKANRRLRITDFGIGSVTARAILAEESRGASTRGGRLLSYLRGSYTPLYSSPQQRDGADPDPRDDVHALGVIGYQMITGHLSQGAGPDFAEDLREAGAGEELITLLGRCVAQKPNRRPVCGAEVAKRLVPHISTTHSHFPPNLEPVGGSQVADKPPVPSRKPIIPREVSQDEVVVDPASGVDSAPIDVPKRKTKKSWRATAVVWGCFKRVCLDIFSTDGKTKMSWPTTVLTWGSALFFIIVFYMQWREGKLWK